MLRARLPQVPIVDLTHEVRPQDVRAGSLALKRAAPYLAAGRRGRRRRPRRGDNRRGPWRCGLRRPTSSSSAPTTACVVPAVDALGGPALAVELENPDYQLPSPGPTFAGRDIFAPAAAYLAAGGDLTKLGPHVDVRTLVRLPRPVCRETDGSLEVEVTWVDRYGNVQLAAGAGALSGLAGRRRHLSVATAGRVRKAGREPEERLPRAEVPAGPGRLA